MRVIGRAAHAGVEPEHRVSASAMTAQAVTRLLWGRLDESTTANVGTIVGGNVRNAVPAEVRLEGELRGHDTQRVAACVRSVREVFETTAAAAGARVEIDMRQMYSVYVLAEDDSIVSLARRAFTALDAASESTLVRTGGGSDANELNAIGIRARVLGIGAEACHSVAETIAVTELQRLTEWILQIVRASAE